MSVSRVWLFIYETQILSMEKVKLIITHDWNSLEVLNLDSIIIARQEANC